ncbi:aldo/keto reductase [Sorangium cellulosum]|uniref:Aldo/keto reductase n=1 Tax=Sorangium cellulosum TaxID=56 RepID=A0A2L0F4P0_SORCE|nr:aldo/keto reductase [Sorangium cellulosum]AUX46461.1 aldo/keto reductase [Sorangium cellulosum]
MNYRLLGRTGIHVSPLTLGCMMFGGRTSAEDSYAIIDRAIAVGINLLDTANVYNDGRSEEIVGDALRRNGHRHHIVLATKVHGNMHKGDGLDPNRAGNSRRQIIEQCEASLRRLKTDWIDLYQIHRPQPECPIDETLRALDDLVRSGKVRYIGSSTFAAWQVVESLWVSKEYGLNRFVTEQPPYNLLDRRIERELIPACKSYGFGILPWSPLAGGFLSGKYRRDGKQPEGRFADGTHQRAPALLGSQRAFEVVEALRKIATEKGFALSQLALAWTAQQPGITSPIIGPRTLEQLEDNLGSLELKLGPEDLARIDAISPPGDVVVPFYQASFGPHEIRW